MASNFSSVPTVFHQFHLDCTRWCRFTFLPRVIKKSRCCWRGNWMSCMIISPMWSVHALDWRCDSDVTLLASYRR